MAEIGDRKLYLGPRLRVLRRELGINQTRMAEELGVSPSYLNHLERNQRPLTGQMLLRLANTYDIDIRSFVAGAGDSAASELGEVFADPLVRDIGTPRQETVEVAENYPGVAEAIVRLYRALSDLRRAPELIEQIGRVAPGAGAPLEWVRDYLGAKGNHLPEIDAAAEAIDAQAGDAQARDAVEREVWLREALRGHGIALRIVPEQVLVGTLRHYDFHRRRLLLSERLPQSSRLFAIAYQLALAALGPLLADQVERATPPDEESRALLKVALANYAAAAIVMPYARFHAAAEAQRYDPALLRIAFGVSFEQLAHRLTTLGRTGARGVPFFMLKTDPAGLIMKRFAGEAFPFARFGGACPRWTIHHAFRTPGEVVTQIVETPDARRFATLAFAYRRVGVPDAVSMVAIGLGCELKHARRIALFDGVDPDRTPATTIGPTCHLCERAACADRALPPVTRSLETNPFQRTSAPYPFRRA